MIAKQRILWLKQHLLSINWKLLVFLLLFLNVKLLIKLLAILLLLLWQAGTKPGLNWKIAHLPFFYPAIILVAFCGFLGTGLFYDPRADLAFAIGISFWVVCLLAQIQVRTFTGQFEDNDIYRTLVLFFLLNAFVSFFQLFRIIWETGALNPYRYQGLYQKYFISTGDYIKGVTFDTSTTNAAINALGIVYFFYRKNEIMVLVSVCTLLLTGSNFIILLTFGLLAVLFFVRFNRDQKSVVVLCLMLLITFMAKVSPQNNNYIQETFNRLSNHISPHQKVVLPKRLQDTPDSLLSAEDRKKKFALRYLDSISYAAYLKNKSSNKSTTATEKPELPVDNIHSAPFQHKDRPTETTRELSLFAAAHQSLLVHPGDESRIPGKWLAFQQTIQYFHQHPFQLITGTGPGNFSSKLAFRTTALNCAGGYPARWQYISHYFLQNHLALYLGYFSSQEKLHSVLNTPNSVYDQLLSEYGLAGCLLFAAGYLWFFFRHRKRKGYALPMLILLLGFFCIDYWFEQLSIVVLFELLLFHDQNHNSYEYPA